MSQKPRIQYFDYSKGFAIILVVLGHVIGGLIPLGLAGPLFYPKLGELIYTFHMPLFFTISGYFFLSLCRRAPADFLINSLQVIIIPYILWSWLFLLLTLVFPSGSNHPLTTQSFYEIFIPGGWVSVYWFLYALLIARAIFYLVMSKTPHLLVPVCLVFGVTCFLARLAESQGMNTIFLPALIKISGAGTFVGFGLILAAQRAVLDVILARRWLPVFAVSWLIGAAIVLRFEAASPLNLITGFFGTALTLSLFYQAERVGISSMRFLSTIGVATVAIFLAHVIFAGVSRLLLLKLSVRNPTAHVLIDTAVGVVGPMILFYVANYLRVAPYVGFGKNIRLTVKPNDMELTHKISVKTIQ